MIIRLILPFDGVTGVGLTLNKPAFVPDRANIASAVKLEPLRVNLRSFGELTVTLDAYPFRIKQAKEGSPYWDDYTILDYNKILTDMCDYINGYFKYKEKNYYKIVIFYN